MLKITEPWLTDVASVPQGNRLPGVRTVAEVWGTLPRIPGRTSLMLRRRYSGGLRLMECVRLRVKEGIALSVERILGPGRLGWVFAVLGSSFEDPLPGSVVEGNLPFAEIVLGIA